MDEDILKKDLIKPRLYQEAIAYSASKANTLVVLPTGTGKTLISLLLSAHRLKRGKVIVLAPSKPLVSQHMNTFKKYLNIREEELGLFTGEIPPEKRKELWGKKKIVFATPQVVENDIISRRVSLEDFSLIVFDEAHRGVGNYAYTFIAKNYVETARDPLILGLTASPGGEVEKIDEVRKNLFIENVEIRTELDSDLKPYVKPIKTNWIRIDLPEEFKEIKKILENALRERLKKLKEYGFVKYYDPAKTSKKDLLDLQVKLQRELDKKPSPMVYHGLSLQASCLRISHALELLETQGISQLKRYLERLYRQSKSGGSKGVRDLVRDKEILRMRNLLEKTGDLEHPKLHILLKEVRKQLDVKKDSKIIVFTQFRDSAIKITEFLKENKIMTKRFVGQLSRVEDKGLSQKEQLRILEEFKEGVFPALVATSIGEEGLDVPEVDLVIFYEPVPSEIRSIQRRGRTGRAKAGKVIILIAKGTRDESYYWRSIHREKKMKKTLKRLKDQDLREEIEVEQPRLTSYDGPEIIIDNRELPSLGKELMERGVRLSPTTLEIGDYILSERVAVERKTVDDFLQSIVDKRLLSQVLELKRNYKNPLLIVEGEGLYYRRNIHPNAIRGTIASIMIDFGLPIYISKDKKETANLLYIIAKREQEIKDKKVEIRGKRAPMSIKEQQRYIVEGLPGVSAELADRLLRHFSTIENLVKADEEELTEVKGIGKTKAEEIRYILTKKYEDD
ncbi:MAG: DEAD/DEAH box helicase [Candidatus Hydrothermarchaeota archaeon]